MNRLSVCYSRTKCSTLDLYLLCLWLSIILSTGCGGTKSSPTTIAFAQSTMAPPSSVTQGSTVQFAAIVTNDPANLGVSWLLSCVSPNAPTVPLAAAECGSITRHTASGVPATFIVTSSLPSGGLTATIEASASASPGASVTQQITITTGPISVAFSPATPTTVVAGADPTISVIVTNDQLGGNGQPEGATLSVTGCSISGFEACGSFSGSEFVTPLTVPTTGAMATIEAVSVADPSATATITITITYPTVTVTLGLLPPASMSAGAAINLAASAAGGGQGNPAFLSGIDWSCSPAPCGFFYPTHTNSGASTSYTAPLGISSVQTITLIATSTYTTVAGQGPVVQAMATVNVTPTPNNGTNNSLLNGQYAFLLTGVNTVGPSSLAGSVIADGNGNITGGEEVLPGGALVYDGIVGSYSIGSDGRGTITLSSSSNSTNVLAATGHWLNGQQTLAIAVVSPTQVLVEEFDGTDTYNIKSNPILSPPYGSTLHGELDIQTVSDFGAPPSGSYVFAGAHGGSPISSTPYAAYYGGVLAANGGNITGFYLDRYYDGTTDSISSAGGIFGSQSFSADDNFGEGTVNIGPYLLNYFIVDSAHIIVLGNSSLDGTGLPAGHMYAQSSIPSPLTGTYAFTLAGSTPIESSNGAITIGSSPEAAGGWFTGDSSGAVSGYLDTNNNGSVVSAPVSGNLVPSVVDSCVVNDVVVCSRWTLALTGGGASQFALYPYPNPTSTSTYNLLVFQLDTRKSGIGSALLQASSLNFLGNYAASIQQLGIFNASRNSSTTGVPVGAWNDLSGQIVASGASTITGALDIDQLNGLFLVPSGNLWTQTVGAAVTGNFAAGTQGRFPGSITIPAAQNAIQPDTLGGVFYVVDDSTVMFLEDDATPAVGILQLQNF